MCCFKITHKATGVSFWMHGKLAFNVRYYSADCGKTWHKTKTKAYRAAVAANTLDIFKSA